jgi:hypothetical protein
VFQFSYTKFWKFGETSFFTKFFTKSLSRLHIEYFVFFAVVVIIMTIINNAALDSIINNNNGINNDNPPNPSMVIPAINDRDSDGELLENEGDNTTKGIIKRGSGYTRTEDLLVCKAFIAASEDSQVGAGQKSAQFKHKMWICYKKLLDEQERMDCVRVNGQVQDGIINVYDRRNGVTVFRRF